MRKIASLVAAAVLLSNRTAGPSGCRRSACRTGCGCSRAWRSSSAAVPHHEP